MFVFFAILFGVAPSALAQNGDWGAVKGRIVWTDPKIPVMDFIAAAGQNPDCLKATNGKGTRDETVIVNKKNKGIKNAFVWLMPPKDQTLAIHPALKAINPKQVEIDQPACHFIPRSIVMREGQELVVKNNADFAHNFNMIGHPEKKNTRNFALPPGGSFTLKGENLPQTQFLPIVVSCNIHSWMKSWIGVYDHPYFALTDENGNFEFKDAPAGDVRLMIYHPEFGFKGGAKGRQGTPVTIKGAPAFTDLGPIPSFP